MNQILWYNYIINYICGQIHDEIEYLSGISTGEKAIIYGNVKQTLGANNTYELVISKPKHKTMVQIYFLLYFIAFYCN